jgi:hypothetical protein
MYLFDWTAPFEPLYGQPILIPSNMVFFRGYDTKYPAISDRVTHYGSQQTASGYALDPGMALGAFTNTRLLRLFDYRYMRLLLQQLFATRTQAAMQHLEPMARITMSYGLCALRDQLAIMRRLLPGSTGLAAVEAFYKNEIDGKDWENVPLCVNPFTPEGIRVAETNNDARTLVFIKQVFGDMVDGFIAPRMSSPFHNEKEGFVSAEMVLFNPKAVGIKEMPMAQLPKTIMTMEQVLNGQSRSIQIKLQNQHTCSYRSRRATLQTGGGHMPQTDTFFDDLSKKVPAVVEQAGQMKKAAAYFKGHMKYVNFTAPHPTVPLSPWMLDQTNLP